jgi:hypothetical protein
MVDPMYSCLPSYLINQVTMRIIKMSLRLIKMNMLGSFA